MLSGCGYKSNDVVADLIVNLDLGNCVSYVVDAVSVENCFNLVKRVLTDTACDNGSFLLGSGVTHGKADSETVKLSLGKGISSNKARGVLSCDYHEGLGKLVGGALNCYLELFHCFKKCGLSFRGGAVDLVCKQKVARYKTFAELEFFGLSVLHIETCDVRSHNVGGKLCSLEHKSCRLGKCGCKGGLTNAGNVLKQSV